MTQWQIQQILTWLNVNSNKCWVDQKSFYINYDLTQWHFEQLMIWLYVNSKKLWFNQISFQKNADLIQWHFKQILIGRMSILTKCDITWRHSRFQNKLWFDQMAIPTNAKLSLHVLVHATKSDKKLLKNVLLTIKLFKTFVACTIKIFWR